MGASVRPDRQSEFLSEIRRCYGALGGYGSIAGEAEGRLPFAERFAVTDDIASERLDEQKVSLET